MCNINNVCLFVDDPKDSETPSSLGPQISNISAQTNLNTHNETERSGSTSSPLKADALLYLGIVCLTGKKQANKLCQT